MKSAVEISRALQAHLAAHNTKVVFSAVLIFLGTCLMWAVLYFLAHWITLFALTAATADNTPVPPYFPKVFWSVAGASIIIAWIIQLLHPDERPRDFTSGRDMVVDVLLAAPRATLSAFNTFRAWQSFSEHELRLAAGLLERVATEGRMNLRSAPIEIPDDPLREKIMFSLQLVEVIAVRREDREWWVTLNPLRPASLRLTETAD